MLPWKTMEFPFDSESRGLPFLIDLRAAHLVFRLDRYFRILRAEFDKGDDTFRFQRGVHGFKHVLRVSEFVIDVYEEDEIAGGVGEFRIPWLAEDGFDVFEAASFRPGDEHVQHLLLDVHRENGPLFAGGDCHLEGVITVSAAEVAYRPARLDS